MYQRYFDLNEPPFKLVPDPALFFPGGKRGEILQALKFVVINGEGITKVVGEVGSGKTMLCRMLMRELPGYVEVVYLATPSLSPFEILQTIATELHLPLAKTRFKAIKTIQKHLLKQHALGKRVLVIIEEAQAMSPETLEEIRYLNNLETTKEKLLQIILFGQPELEETLCQPKIRQFRERITHSFCLEPLRTAETKDYIKTRLRACGCRIDDLFSDAAIRRIVTYSNGLLRRINILAEKSLLAVYAAQREQVLPVHVDLAVKESAFSNAKSKWQHLLLLTLSLLAVAWLIVQGVIWQSARVDAALTKEQAPGITQNNKEKTTEPLVIKK